MVSTHTYLFLFIQNRILPDWNLHLVTPMSSRDHRGTENQLSCHEREKNYRILPEFGRLNISHYY